MITMLFPRLSRYQLNFQTVVKHPVRRFQAGLLSLPWLFVWVVSLGYPLSPSRVKAEPLRQTGLVDLIHWNFDLETDVPRIPEGSKVQGTFYTVGVKRGAYASGSPGKAASATQWMTTTGSAWMIRVTTIGYEQLRINAKQYSSATGPSAFYVQYSLDSVLWKPLIEVSVKSTFAVNFSSDGLSLPAEVNHRQQIWIRWQLKHSMAVNGGAISNAGTSRIDEIILKGYPLVEGLAELPQTPASNLTLAARTDSVLSLQWKSGSGSRRLVIGLQDSMQSCAPMQQVSYDPDSPEPDRRIVKGGCPVLYNGSAQTFLHLSLQPLTNYGYAVIEYNGLPGREHYRWQDAPRLFVKTRARPPSPPDTLRVLELTGDQAHLRPPATAPAELRLVFASQRPTYDQLLSLEKDRYIRVDTTGLFRLFANDTLIRVPRSVISLLPLWYWSVNGPPGDRSPQLTKLDSLIIAWPHLQPSGQLAQWSFDDEQLLPMTNFPDFVSSAFETSGAVITGFNTGFTGKAVSLNQWAYGNPLNTGVRPKSWSIRIPSFGLDRLRLQFRMISSASGPFQFRFECSSPTMRLYQGGTYEPAVDWKSSRLQQIDVPEVCMNQDEVQLALVLTNPQTRNGQPISNAGTLRIDQLSLEGSYRTDALPVPLAPQITRLDDQGVWWLAKLGSNAGKTLSHRFVELAPAQPAPVLNALESSPQRFPLPLTPYVNTGQFTSLTSSHPYALRHCVSFNQVPVCSPQTIFTTPFAIPPRAEPYALNHHVNDSISLSIGAQADQLWMVWTHLNDPMPKALDSLTVFCSTGTPCVSMDTLDTGNLYGRGRLQPGRSYRLWILASNGPLGRQRYSKPPHASVEVRMPALPPPAQGVRELMVAEQSYDQLHLRWQASQPQPVLVLACPDSLVPARPLDDLPYPFNPRFPLAGRINPHTFVLYDGEATELRIHELPLQASWSVIVVPYHARNGAITYGWEQRTAIKVKTFPDPRKHTISARSIPEVPLDSAFHILGTVLWNDSSTMILHSGDANLLIEHPEGHWSLRQGDSLAIRAQRQTKSIRIQYLIKTGIARTSFKPYVVSGKQTTLNLESKALLVLGNVLRLLPDEPSGSLGVPLVQRGDPRRSIYALGPAKVLSNLPESGETALIGIPLLNLNQPTGSLHSHTPQQALRLWIPGNEHILPYTTHSTQMDAPNLHQIFSWSSQTDDTILFSWQPYAMVRPYDQFPDSVQRQWVVRIRNRLIPAYNRVTTRSSTNGLSFSARELFTALAPADSMGAELEWSLLPYLMSHHHAVISLTATPWQSFFVYRLRLTGSDPDIRTDLSTRWHLGPAYPNPFNPLTRFEVMAPRYESFSLRVYDSLGRLIQVLYEGALPAGKHTFAWNSGALPTGVYFIRLISPETTLTRLVTVMG